MKKAILASLLAIAACTVFAQTERGKIFLSGSSNASLGWTGYKYDSGNTDAISFNIAPAIGIFVVKGLVIGAELPLSFYHYKNDNAKENGFDLGVGPFARYYFGSGKIKPLVGLKENILYNHYKYSYTGDYSDYEETSDEISLSSQLFGGIAYFPNERVAFEALMNLYSLTPISQKSSSTYNGRVGLNVGIGVSVFLK